MPESLLLELERFIDELKKKEAAAVYTIPTEIMGNVKKAKHLENFLHEIFNVVTGSGGIHLMNIIRREFGMYKELADHFDQWAPYTKEQFEDALHDAIDRAEIRAGKQGLFFEHSAGKKERNEALDLLKDIAHAAVKCQFHAKVAGPESYVDILDKVLTFFALPNTYPAGNLINYRSLISEDRLQAMAGNNGNIAAALKAHAREWYQHSSFTFLENSSGYHTYEYVRNYLYVLTEEQLEGLRQEYIRIIRDEFGTLKVKPDLHRAEYLKTMLETVLSWTV